MAVKGKPKVRGPKKPVAKGSIVKIKTVIKHPMEWGYRPQKGDDGKHTFVPSPEHAADHIDKVTVEYMGKTVISSQWTGAVSKNPYFIFRLRAVEAGPVKVTWSDKGGQSFDKTIQLKVK
ncbi:thiosulfate oxidation carrier complex protein SoxZ [Magnetococcales bacterium HHB-1]